MKRLTERELQEYLSQIEQFHIIIPTEGGIKTIRLEDIQTPPIRRVSMKSVDLETQISFMPRDIARRWISRIGNVWEALFVKDKI